MKAKIYNYDTIFDFGKHKGKSLKKVINIESRYIGYIYLANIRRVILDPTVLKQLNKERFFDDLEFPYYGPGGSIAFKDTNIKKEEIIKEFERRYEAYIQNPSAYETSC